VLLNHGPASPASALGSTVVPVPAQVFPSDAGFTLTVSAAIFASREATEVAQYLSALLRPPTGYDLPISTNTPSGGIALLIDRAVTGYRMKVTDSAITIRASTAEGLFHGVQTLRQSLPVAIERRTLQAGPWTVPGGVINDRPRFQYRGAMLDVARHFMDVATVMRYLDDLALYKINTLHLHLTDDQGWRIEIDSWPRLATYGGSIEAGGGQGGTTPRTSTATSSSTPGTASSQSFPRSICPAATPMLLSPPTRNSTATAWLPPCSQASMLVSVRCAFPRKLSTSSWTT
jgi:hexosaminidase